MDDLKQKLTILLSSEVSHRSILDYKKLITFIDATIAQSLNQPPEEKTSFLIANILSMRDFMQSEIISKTITADTKSKVLQVYDNHFEPKEKKEEIIKKKE